jgi:AAA+ superfamily predicted ATPase
VYCNTKNSKFSSDFFSKNEKEILQIASFFNTNTKQAVILAIIFNQCIKERYTDALSIVTHLGLEPIELLGYVQEFEALVEKGIIYKSTGRTRINESFITNNYYINPAIVNAIVNNTSFSLHDKRKFRNNIDFLECISEMKTETGYGAEPLNDISDKFCSLIAQNPGLSLIKRMQQLKITSASMYVFFILVWETLNGDEACVVSDSINNFYKEKKERVRFIQSFLKNKNGLVKKKLVVYSEEPFFNSLQITLTQKSLDLLSSEGIQAVNKNTSKHKNIVNYSSITPKKLHYNDIELQEIEQIKRTIHKSNLRKTINNLKNNGLNQSISVLLFGQPGTGKTELVKQLALQAKRDIYFVDISTIKNKWFGESEKALKKVFYDYNNICKNTDIWPIMLLDEADAIIGKRKLNNNTSVSQTENTLQNILLGELDNFEGILIGTTNLAENFDEAFERRFLYKVNIKKPSAQIRKKLWKIKIQGLSENQYSKLSEYSLSGGEIDNVIRKYIINKALFNNSSFSQLIESCQIEESSFSEKNRSKIGF